MQHVSLGYTTYSCGTTNVVASGTACPESACKLLEILSCDKYAGTLLRFGEEGTHWALTADGQADCAAGSVKDSGIKYWYGVQLGDITNCVLPTDVPLNFRQQLEDLNATGIYSDNLGFIADATVVEAELAAVSATYDEYVSNTTLASGMLTEAETEAMYDEFLTKLAANGVDTIVTEYQNQLDTWRSAQ